MDYELNGNENQIGNNAEENHNPAEYFKVTPDDYTESDSNTIVDFDDEEDSKTQNQIMEHNEENNLHQNQASENHEDLISHEDHGNENNIDHQNIQSLEHQEEGQENKHDEDDAHNKEENQEAGEEQQNGEEKEEQQEDEQENQEEDEENGITDPNVKQLMKMDLADKDGIIDLLMKDNLVKKSDIKSDKIIREKNKARFEHVESTIGKKPIGNKKSSYGRKGFQITTEDGNPEFIKDMNIAAYAVKDQIEEENKDVAKILFDENIEKKINKRITREQIDQKVKMTLEKKKKNLEKIVAQMNEQQKVDETFTPVINHRRWDDEERRGLHKFLKDQKKFSQKIKEKRENLLNKKQEKDNKENVGKPAVDKNSEELAKKINNTEQPAYLRLYNKRVIEKERIAEKEKLIKNKRKEEIDKIKKQINENKKLYGHIQSKIDMGQKKEIPVYDKFGNVENKKEKENKELEKEKLIQNKMKKKKGKLLDIKDIPTNKMLLNNFEKKYEEEIKKFTNDNLSETDFHNLLFNLGMVSSNLQKEEENEEKREENEEEKSEKKIKPEISIENPLKQEETKLINEISNCIKNDQGEISKEIIKDFLICVLGLQKYEFYHRYKKEHESELKDLFPQNKFKKEDVPELIIKKRNEEIISKVDKNSEKNNKYAYRTSDGNIYISLEKGHSIKKDFSMLALNYRNSKKPSKDINTLLKDRKVFNFKPTINENSEKLYQKYKDKVVSIQNDSGNITSQGKDSHMEYIERILLHDKKRISENQKVKEELEKEQLKECTFQPKINHEYLTKKEKKSSDISNNKDKKNRMVELYEKGTADIKKRKNRTKDEMEIERNYKELTFHPRIQKEEKNFETKFSNDIYNEKEYRNLYDRLKRGRMERRVKESAHDRYGLDKDLKKFVKQSKENKNREYLEEEKIQYDYEIENNGVVRNTKIKTEKNEGGKRNTNVNKNDEENYNNSMDQSSEEEGEKKDGIPLLIIDVNIRQGVKKKIYVYEGDTPEGLAEKFAKEHNLEEETKNKLQNLIQNHMQRLLTRIEEENQSISEKSQTTHNNKK